MAMAIESVDKTLKLHISGMHCPNCDIIVARRCMDIPGVRAASANYRKGYAEITHDGGLALASLQEALSQEGYGASVWDSDRRPSANTWRDYAEIAGIFVLVCALLFVLSRAEVLPSGIGVSEEMSYGLVLMLGLVASVSSCMAVTGGLLLGIAAKYNETHATLSPMERMKSHLYFNIGRVLAYTVFGGAIGALGSALILSPEINGVLMLAASAVMIVLGLHMLRLFPANFVPTLPRSFSEGIHRYASSKTKRGALALGASTFFLPCGFTQALQLYVLVKGSAVIGALTMLTFSIATLPALLSLSAVSSFAKGRMQKHFLRVAGAAVIVLGAINIQYGLTLIGMSAAAAAQEATPPKQIVTMTINGYDYRPNRFTVQQGVPVEWHIDASRSVGCGLILLAPRLGIRKFLNPHGENVITFTPEQAGEFQFNCGMGMMTRDSKFIVVPNDRIGL
jgi:uncharacterized protein